MIKRLLNSTSHTASDAARRTGVLAVLRDSGGNVFPLAAVGMVALAGMVGGGVDVSRAYMVQNRLQNACDAGVLAGRRAIGADGYTTAAEAKAEELFAINFDADIQGASSLVFTTQADDEDNTVFGMATANVDTTVMRLFSFDEIPVEADCSATMQVGNSDVMMVLDTTGSMGGGISGGGTRIAALRSAMKSFYNTVSTAVEGGNGRVRFGFVPYSSTVNVGSILYNKNPDWLVDNWTYQSREPQYREVEHEVITGYEPPYFEYAEGTQDRQRGGWQDYGSDRFQKNNDCRAAMPANTSYQDVDENGDPIDENDIETDDDGNVVFGDSPPPGGTREETQYIDSDQRRITQTTWTKPQQARQYRCQKVGNTRRIQVRITEQTFFRHRYAIEEPIFTTSTTSEFERYLYKAVEYDVSNFKAFSNVTTVTGNNGSNQTSRWRGCIEERDTVSEQNFSYSKITGLSPAEAIDLDLDTAPTSDDKTKWRPLWDQISYYRTTNDGRYLTSAAVSERGGAANGACPVAARQFATMTKSEFDAYADSLSPGGNTYHDIGMIWGARLTSPTGMFQDNVQLQPANGGSVARHIIYMTDGELVPNITIHSAYGIEYHDRRVTDNGYSNHTSRHNSRFLATCAAAKAKGIRVWVIAFGSGLTGDLEQCASTQSSFVAADANSLNEAFQEIGKTIGELRVVQ